jgi:cytochrome c oxidase subunit III
MTTPAAILTKSPPSIHSESSEPTVAHHFDDWEQQYDSCVLGMWAFLVSEVMFFGGLFATYMVYRFKFPEAFDHASEHLDIVLGGFNTFVLLTSSLTMALAVRAAHLGQRRQIALLIALTMALGLVFLGVKGLEYFHKYEDGLAPLLGLGLPFRYEGAEPGPTQLFYGLYFAMTGVHAIHMIIGIAILGLFIRPALRGAYSGANSLSVEIIGLYWHFVDLVWIFLFPLLYLIDRSA